MTKSVVTQGRTLDHAAIIYDLVEPMILLGKEKKINQRLISLLQVSAGYKVLDVGCGTGVLTHMISDYLDVDQNGYIVGVDAAGKMIDVARKKRGSSTCRFDTAAAEHLPYENECFDAAISTLFFHHVNLTPR